MCSLRCNIDMTDRINRLVIGLVLCISALIGMGWVFFMIIGLILAIEGIIGWCGIPHLISKIKRLL